MLVEFRVKNFRSFRDEQVLSMVASKDDSLPQNTFEAGGMRLLRTAAIYGPNASGKSNLIKAMGFFRDMVVHRNVATGTTQDIAVTPFALSKETRSAPSEFEMAFLSGSTLFRYGFRISSAYVHREWLDSFPGNRKRRIFLRESGPSGKDPHWTFGPTFRGEKMRLAQFTGPDSLFLGVAAAFNNEQLMPLHQTLKDKFFVLDDPAAASIGAKPHLLKMLTTEQEHEKVIEFLKAFDTGIDGLKLTHTEEPDLDVRRVLSKHPTRKIPPGLKEILPDLLRRVEVQTMHRTKDDSGGVLFLLKEESAGTQRILNLAWLWLSALRRGIAVVLDELDASLHPLLSRRLVKLFQNPGTNKANAQLIFSTHDVTLLDRRLLRRDQIWFTQKEHDGATHLYSLYDFEDKARKDEALQKRYMEGRYGALPVLAEVGEP